MTLTLNSSQRPEGLVSNRAPAQHPESARDQRASRAIEAAAHAAGYKSEKFRIRIDATS